MDILELLKLSINALKVNKMRSILTMLGVIIGVFAVIVLVSMGSGLKKYITDQISGLGSNLIFVIPGQVGGSRTPGGQQTNKLTINDARRLDTKLKAIADVGPVVQKPSTIKYKNKTDKQVSVLGTTSNYPDIVINAGTTRGVYFNLSQEKSGAHVTVIGKTVQERLFGDGNPIGEKISVEGKKYTIIGVMKKRGALFGIDQDNAIVIPINAATRQFGVDKVNAIYLAAKRPELVELVKKQARQALLQRLTEDDFTLQTQEQTLNTIGSVIGALTIALGGIAAISLLVGGIGVMNIMLVSVTERTKEIGLRKALGAKRSDILSQFIFEAIMLSVTGGVIGIILGLGVSVLLSQVFLSEVTPWSVFLAFLFSVAVGLIFGIAPAYRASRLSAIEALRYE